MAKPIIRYKPVATPDKVHHKMNYIPTIVDREDKIGLDQIIIRAIDHGRIVGVKAEAAAGLANGIAAQMYSEFCDGKGVKVGNYFYGQLFLRGTTTEDGRLTDANELHVALYKGKGFALSRDMFSFQNVEAADVPNLDFAMSYADVVLEAADMSVCGPALIRLGMPGSAEVGKGAFQVVRTNTETQRATESQLLVANIVTNG